MLQTFLENNKTNFLYLVIPFYANRAVCDKMWKNVRDWQVTADSSVNCGSEKVEFPRRITKPDTPIIRGLFRKLVPFRCKKKIE